MIWCWNLFLNVVWCRNVGGLISSYLTFFSNEVIVYLCMLIPDMTHGFAKKWMAFFFFYNAEWKVIYWKALCIAVQVKLITMKPQALPPLGTLNQRPISRTALFHSFQKGKLSTHYLVTKMKSRHQSTTSACAGFFAWIWWISHFNGTLPLQLTMYITWGHETSDLGRWWWRTQQVFSLKSSIIELEKIHFFL